MKKVKSSKTRGQKEMLLSELQSILKKKEKELRVKFVSLTKKEKDILAKTVKLQEEVGELANDVLATLSLQRESKLRKFNKTNLYQEFADIIISLAALANILEVDLTRAVRSKLRKILKEYIKDTPED